MSGKIAYEVIDKNRSQLEKLSLDFGEKNVKAVQKRIENMEKMN